MELLRADDQVHVRQPVNQLLPAALRHATHETQHHVRPVRRTSAATFCIFRMPFAPPHPARCTCSAAPRPPPPRTPPAYSPSPRVVPPRPPIALVHLATVCLDVNTRHNPQCSLEFTTRRSPWKATTSPRTGRARLLTRPPRPGKRGRDGSSPARHGGSAIVGTSRPRPVVIARRCGRH